MSDHAGGERSITANRPLAAIIAAGLAVRLALTPLYAHLPNGLFDEGFWKHWMERIHQHGVLNIFRTSDTDYVGYHWVLWLLSLIYEWVGGPYTQTTPSLHILVKMPSILFDVALILVVYAGTKMLAEELGRGGRPSTADRGAASGAPTANDGGAASGAPTANDGGAASGAPTANDGGAASGAPTASDGGAASGAPTANDGGAASGAPTASDLGAASGAPTADAAGSSRRVGLFAAAVIAFHPAVLYDSAVWAQTDSAITAAMLGAILLAYRARPLLSGAAIGLGAAVKPHPVIMGPLLLLLLWRSRGSTAGGYSRTVAGEGARAPAAAGGRWRAVGLAGAGFAIVAVVVLGPWILHGDGGRIVDVYRTLFSKDHGRLSELAWNLWWMFDYAGDPRPGTAVFSFADWLTYRELAFALSGAAALLALAYAWRRPSLEGALIAAAYQAFAFYALPVASHERYMYPLLALLLPVALLRRGWLWLYVPLSVTFFTNLVVVAPPVDAWSDRWVYGWFGAYVAGVNMTLFTAYTAVLVVDIARGAGERRHSPASAIFARDAETVDSVARRL